MKQTSKKESKFSLKTQIQSEKSHQKQYIEWANLHWFGPFVVHVENELLLGNLMDPKKNPSGFFRLLNHRKSMGVKRGYPDILIDVPVHPYHGFRLELKRKGEEPTDAQREYLAKLSAMDYFACWSDNIDESIRLTQEYFGELMHLR